MKRFSYLIILVAALFVAAACTNKKAKTREEQIEDFRSELTTADTTAMLKLADDAMALLKQKKIDEVIASLYEYDDSTEEVKPLSPELAKRYTRKFKMFPVIEYQRQYFSFMLQGCNDVKYEVLFATAEQTGNGFPAKTMFMFNPVRVDGEWKLCVKNAGNEFDVEMQ